MVKHCKGENDGKHLVAEWHCRSITDLHDHLFIGNTLTEGVRQLGVYLQARDVPTSIAQPVCCEAWSRPEFQHLSAQIHSVERPRQDLIFESVFPPARLAIPMMQPVHRFPLHVRQKALHLSFTIAVSVL